MKKIYVLYSKQDLFKPKIYKTLVFMKHIVDNQEKLLTYKTFQSQEKAHQFITNLTGIQSLPKVKSQKINKVPLIKKKKQDDNEQQKNTTFQNKFKNLPESIRNEYFVKKMFIPGKLLMKIQPENHYISAFDGCSKGNPGLSGIGYFINYENKKVLTNSLFIGTQTNNVAQFVALFFLLLQAYCHDINKLTVIGDSKLAIKALLRQYQIVNKRLIGLLAPMKLLASLFQSINFQHVSRAYNVEADKLSNIGVKKRIFQKTMSNDKQ